MDPIVIASYVRTPMANFQGAFSSLSSPQLGAAAIRAACERASVNAEQVDEVIMGCVLPAGLGQAPARQAAHHAGLAWSTAATTVNKMCGSGMKAMMLAFDSLRAESRDIVIAGGMESMTNAPYLLPKARGGYRLGHERVIDSMFFDGLEDAYDQGKLMGCFADDTAAKYNFTREAQDEFARQSQQRALDAQANHHFDDEIVPVEVTTRKATLTVSTDEGPDAAKLEKISRLKPAFGANGTVTAANASSISDGAAALILTRQSIAKQQGLPIHAIIHAHATHAQEPAWFTTAPVGAINKVCAAANWQISDVDLFEINEAFAVVTMATMHDCDIAHEKVNIHGGACALGHPIGASGARIVVTLLNALKQTNQHKGIASLCIGGGEATALAIERVSE